MILCVQTLGAVMWILSIVWSKNSSSMQYHLHTPLFTLFTMAFLEQEAPLQNALWQCKQYSIVYLRPLLYVFRLSEPCAVCVLFIWAPYCTCVLSIWAPYCMWFFYDLTVLYVFVVDWFLACCIQLMLPSRPSAQRMSRNM